MGGSCPWSLCLSDGFRRKRGGGRVGEREGEPKEIIMMAKVRYRGKARPRCCCLHCSVRLARDHRHLRRWVLGERRTRSTAGKNRYRCRGTAENEQWD